MTTQRPISREPSRLSIVSIPQSQRTRRASTESNENVFSDDHEPDSPITIDDAPLGDVPPSRQQFFDNPFHDRHASTTSLRRAPSPTQFDRSSIRKQRLMIDDAPSSSTGLRRTPSTASRISIPRADSPYRGPTAPSHPYGMYTQMARSGSIASQSTFRPGPETPFIPQGGPAHPYHMYPQNTVPTDEDEDITTNGFPLGFPRTNISSSNGATHSDVGEIVGADGHIEQLPPYSRYADNTVAKGNMDRINRARSMRSVRSARSTAPTQISDTTTAVNAASVGDSEANLLERPRELFEEETEAQRARKEGWQETWKDRLRKQTRCGIPLWGLLAIVAIVLASATAGGIVGGVIGNKAGAQRAYANAATTTTIWLDAIPTTLGPNASPLPTGYYQIPFNQTQEIKQCIPPAEYNQYEAAWGCMDIAYIGVSVDSANNAMTATFEDFSVNTQDFKYGPQPPDFNGSSFALQPMQDKDAGAWGVAMFFSVLFDKLSILPQDALSIAAGKRSFPDEVARRSIAAYDGMPLQPSDKPWFCFWNSTISEFFIYVNEAAPDATISSTQHNYQKWTGGSSSTTPQTTAAAMLATTSVALMQEVTTATTAPTQAPTTFLAYNPSYPGAAATVGPTKRSYETSQANVSNYPKLVKMVEKRMPEDAVSPSSYVKPYCQQMQVLDDWSIEPLLDVPTVCIEEVLYTPSTTTTSNAKRTLLSRWTERDPVGDLESYCICEWTSY